MDVPRKKLALARLLNSLARHRTALDVQTRLVGPFVRAVNYHATPSSDVASFRAQLELYREHYADVTLSDLRDLLTSGRWGKSKPGLILSFDDGYLDNASVAAPLLEEYGFTGWFFVPSQFVAAGDDSPAGIAQPVKACIPAGRLRELSRRHVIGSHSRTHCRLRSTVDDERLRAEIVDSKAELEAILGAAVEVFCWVGGEEDTYSREASAWVRRAGYEFAFMTNSAPITRKSNRLQLQRTNIEASWPLEVLEFQLSGLVDLLYGPKRFRVNRTTRS